jgi:hypothetical protein
MTRFPVWFRRRAWWVRAVLGFLLVAGLVVWCLTSKRVLGVMLRIVYALSLALPPVLLIGVVLTIVYYLTSRDSGGARNNQPPVKRR